MPTVADLYFDDVPPAASVSAAVRKRWRELEALSADLIGGRVRVTASHAAAPADSLSYRVDVRMQLPGRAVLVVESGRSAPCRDALVAVHDAFDRARHALAARARDRRALRIGAVRPQDQPASRFWKDEWAVPA